MTELIPHQRPANLSVATTGSELRCARRRLVHDSRRDGITLGGTHVQGDWSLQPDVVAPKSDFTPQQ
jgi:hypothetical protein